MMTEKIEEMKRSMLEAGVVSAEDIDRICKLEDGYDEECRCISEMCVEEGLPANGSTYDLRCENVRKYYQEAIDSILAQYDEEAE